MRLPSVQCAWALFQSVIKIIKNCVVSHVSTDIPTTLDIDLIPAAVAHGFSCNNYHQLVPFVQIWLFLKLNSARVSTFICGVCSKMLRSIELEIQSALGTRHIVLCMQEGPQCIQFKDNRQQHRERIWKTPASKITQCFYSKAVLTQCFLTWSLGIPGGPRSNSKGSANPFPPAFPFPSPSSHFFSRSVQQRRQRCFK